MTRRFPVIGQAQLQEIVDDNEYIFVDVPPVMTQYELEHHIDGVLFFCVAKLPVTFTVHTQTNSHWDTRGYWPGGELPEFGCSFNLSMSPFRPFEAVLLVKIISKRFPT